MSDDYDYKQAGYDNFLRRSIDNSGQETLNTPLPAHSMPKVTNQQISESTGNVLNLGKVKINGVTGEVISNNETAISETINRIYPVGSIYISTLASNPADLLGIGKWETFGAGKTFIGVDKNDTEFDTVEETGGTKTHTLTTAEMPAHVHGGTYTSIETGVTPGATAQAIIGTGANTGSAGSGGAHNNLQPYITVYIWKRIK